MSLEDQYNKHLSEISDMNEHLPTLRQYADGCVHVTEFGVRKGVSLFAWLSAKVNKVVGYDVFTPFFYGGATPEELTKLAREEGVEFEFHKQSTLEADIEETDILFIDTLHTYDQLTQELTLHSKKARKYIILHDTVTFGKVGEDGKEGLQKAIKEFLTKNKKWVVEKEFENNNGLTILKRN